MNVSLIGAFGAIGTLALGLIAMALRYAYEQGKTDNRLATLEAAQKGAGDVPGVIGALAATVEALKGSVDRLDRAVEALSVRVNRGRKADDA